MVDTKMSSMHDALAEIACKELHEMNSIEDRSLAGDDIAYLAIQAAGGGLFDDSNIDSFEHPPADVYPFARPTGTHM